jgi:hypothetical protein
VCDVYSVVITEDISTGRVTSNLISDIISPFLIDLTLALIVFLAPCFMNLKVNKEESL